jgi:hypothetical protein
MMAGKVLVVSEVTMILTGRLYAELELEDKLQVELEVAGGTCRPSETLCPHGLLKLLQVVCWIFSMLCCRSDSDSERWTEHEHMYADETNAPSLSLLSCTRRLRFQLWYRHGDGPSSVAAYAIALSRAACGVAMLAWHHWQGSGSGMDCAL